MMPPSRSLIVATLATAAAGFGAEWLLRPAYPAALLLASCAATGIAISRRRPILAGLSLVALLISVLALAGTHRIAVARGHWREVREARTAQAFNRLSDALHGLLSDTERLADSAGLIADAPPERLFRGLDALLPRGVAEMAVVVFDSAGDPVGWAGRSRVEPTPAGELLDVRFERYHAAFEVRRAATSGRVVLASGLLWADPSVPRPHRSLLAWLGTESGVDLQIHPPGAVPDSVEVFDYVQPSPRGDRLLFSVEPVAPDSAAIVGQAEQRYRRAFGWALVLFLAGCLLAAPEARTGLVAALGLAWLLLRSPFGALLLSERLFSPATFVLPAIRPAGASAGHLIVTGLALLVVAAVLARWPAPANGWPRALGWLLLVTSPPVALYLASGIQPPPLGVESTLWLTWQVAIALPLAGVGAIAGVLTGRGRIGATIPAAALAGLAGFGAALASIHAWTPAVPWPWWFPLLWLPALGLSNLPEHRGARLALVIGLSAAMAATVTWQAELKGRLGAAERDVHWLGTREDPLAEPLLLRLADQARGTADPQSAAGLYLLWARSDVAGQDFPARLSLWDSTGLRTADLALDSLDVPTAALASLVREYDSTAGAVVRRLDRVPGRHYVLLAPLPGRRILSVALGPRTRLVTPSRLARILRPAVEVRPPYDIMLSPPEFGTPGEAPEGRWRRTGSGFRADTAIAFADGGRHVRVTVPLRGTWMLTAYGLLMVVEVEAIALAIFALVFLLTGERHWIGFRRGVWSFRFRLTIALALFFIAPMVIFAAWGLARADQENERARDAGIASVLRNAVVSAGDLLGEPPQAATEDLAGLAARLESDLYLYRGGRLTAASQPLLIELGLVEPLEDPSSFLRLALGDEIELTRQAAPYVSPVRLGYRLVRAGPPGAVAILATPQLAADWRRQQVQRDLSVLLLLAVVTGIGAALVGARVAARALSRPVAELERSAEAIGAGHEPPSPIAPPLEFERVFAAFSDMAADVQAAKAALEGARQRTAAVLAQVATGVIALEPGGRILLANARAREVLGARLAEGERLASALPPDGAGLAAAVRHFETTGSPAVTREIELGGRVLRLQLARLAGAAGGVVVAIDDLTDVTRAARVLAWGEMAQQVAHEIKNPLTPIRLGVQHLRRVERERPEALPAALEEITARILSEIERLDGIARGFSRFAAPAAEHTPLEGTEVGDVARQVAALYRLGGSDFLVSVSGPELIAPCRRDELHEVLGNLVANARNAKARHVELRMHQTGLEVSDDGVGIAPEVLSRVFEPRFSTNTSGTGLGLAIVRRLVESWGARVEIRSAVGKGTTVLIHWPAGGAALPD